MAIGRADALRAKQLLERRQRSADFRLTLTVFKHRKDIHSLARLDAVFGNCFNSHLTMGQRNISSTPISELQDILAHDPAGALSAELSAAISAFGDLILEKAPTAQQTIAGLTFDISDLRVIRNDLSGTDCIQVDEIPKRAASLFFYLTRIEEILRISQVTLGVRANYGTGPIVAALSLISSFSRVTTLFHEFNRVLFDPVDVEGYLMLFLDTHTPFPIKDGILELHALENAALELLDK